MGFSAKFQEMKTLETPEEVEVFLLHHGEKIVELIGGEIDRVERVLKVVQSDKLYTHCKFQNNCDAYRITVKLAVYEYVASFHFIFMV